MFSNYTKKVKELLLEKTPLECVGKVTILMSKAAKQDFNKIQVEATISNQLTKVSVTLDSETYLQAIEAHKNEDYVRIVGMPKQNKGSYTITKLISFTVIQPRRS